MIVCGWVCYSMTVCVVHGVVVCSAWQHDGYVYGMCGAWCVCMWCMVWGGVVHGVSVCVMSAFMSMCVHACNV